MKIRVLIVMLVATVAALVTIVGCRKKEEPKVLTLDKQEIVLTKSAPKATLGILSNTEWLLSGEGITPYLGKPVADGGWFTIAPYSGAKDGQVVFSLKEDGIPNEAQSKTVKVTGPAGEFRLIVKFEVTR